MKLYWHCSILGHLTTVDSFRRVFFQVTLTHRCRNGFWIGGGGGGGCIDRLEM